MQQELAASAVRLREREEQADAAGAELTALAGHLKAVSNLKEEDAGEGCVSAVTTVLESLTRCLDPVAGASRVLVSVDAGARMRGLEVLRALPRVVLVPSVEAEVSELAPVPMSEAELVEVAVSEAQRSKCLMHTEPASLAPCCTGSVSVSSVSFVSVSWMEAAQNNIASSSAALDTDKQQVLRQ